MKNQYFGDSKDSFKWDYHDYLASTLRFPSLHIIPMLTPDDQSGQGKTSPERFPARKEVISFCDKLTKQRSIHLLRQLPTATGASYVVDLHKPQTDLSGQERAEYFTGLPTEGRHLFLFDPDNGFEPERSYSEKHVLYSDVAVVSARISRESLISVFQHFRRIPFHKDIARIKERLASGHVAAVCWHSLMFVVIAKTRAMIEEVIVANRKYSQKYSVVKAMR